MTIYGKDEFYFRNKEGKLNKLRIEQDDDCTSPRDWDNLCKMACFSSRYSLGDEHEYSGDEEDFFTQLCQEYLSEQQIKSLTDKFMENVYITEPQGEMPDKKAHEDLRQDLLTKCNNLIFTANTYGLQEVAMSIKSYAERTVRERDKEFKTKIGLATDYTVVGDSTCSHKFKGTEEECNDYVKELREQLLNGDIFLASAKTYSDVCRALDESDVLVRPLYLYDHSGISISLGQFSDSWDSGQIGWIYVDKKTVFAECNYRQEDGTYTSITGENWRSAALQYMNLEVEIYDQYLRGENYGFIQYEYTEEQEWEEVHSCWGFIGDDLETNGILDDIGVALEDLKTSESEAA